MAVVALSCRLSPVANQMTSSTEAVMLRRLLLLATIAGLAACQRAPSAKTMDLVSEAHAESVPTRGQAPYVHALERMDGSHLKVTVVEVRYGPGESSKPHSHPCPVIGYVLAGSLRTKVHGEAEAIYNAGDAFYEAPGGIHEISANASKTKPARFIAYFVCDHETPLSVAPPSK